MPTLLVNAKNDPFLAPSCFPEAEARESDYFHFEATEHGGHVGFAQFRRGGWFWSEERAFEFIARAVAAELDRTGPARSEAQASAAKKTPKKAAKRATKRTKKKTVRKTANQRKPTR